MTDLNHVVLIGRITQDVGADERSFGYTNNGQARANISIAVNRSKKNGDQWVDDVSYFNIALWGKTAENLKQYLTKGKQICVEGHLHQDRWEKDGQKQSRISISADTVQLLGGNNNNEGGVPSKPANNGYAGNNNGGYNNAGINNSFNNGYGNNNRTPAPQQQSFPDDSALY